jgi:hypothetical protein
MQAVKKHMTAGSSVRREGVSMHSGYLLAGILFAILTSGCFPPPVPPAKQPEPNRPNVRDWISGLPEDTLVTIHIDAPSSREAVYGTRRGNGPWEAEISEASGVDFVVTAEAEGYVSQPVSYTVHLSGTRVFVVEGGQIRGDARYISFHFNPICLP